IPVLLLPESASAVRHAPTSVCAALTPAVIDKPRHVPRGTNNELDPRPAPPRIGERGQARCHLGLRRTDAGGGRQSPARPTRDEQRARPPCRSSPNRRARSGTLPPRSAPH